MNASRHAPPSQAPREPNFLLAPLERRLVNAVVSRIPGRIRPEHLNALGAAAAIGAGLSYWLSDRDASWLWLAAFMVLLHWLGDTLDGNLARARHQVRERYGYYLDHGIDAAAVSLILVGLGLSPFVELTVALGVLAAYLLLSINVYLEAQVFHKFRLGYGWLGPSEAHLALIILTGLSAAGVINPGSFTAFDTVLILATGGMVVLFLHRLLRNLIRLHREDPPR